MSQCESVDALESAFLTKGFQIESIGFNGFEFSGFVDKNQGRHLDVYVSGYAFIWFCLWYLWID